MNAGFPERFDFLMALTRTTNSALARELSFDASYICRIRNGKRGVPQRQPFVEPVAGYLAKRIGKSYQMQAIERELGMPVGSWPASDQAAALLASWLADGVAPGASVGRVEGEGATIGRRPAVQLASAQAYPARESAWAEWAHAGSGAGEGAKPVTGADAGWPAGVLAAQRHADDEVLSANIQYGVGYAGKRAVVKLFLSRLAASGAAHRLLLHSDERLDWIAGDSEFERQWIDLTEQLLRSGSSITIVHTVTRDIDEMLNAIRRWLPLYLLGDVESYYCARIRDGINGRTLFVAEGALAVTSGSVGGDELGAISALHDESVAVASFAREAHALLELCRPLVSRVDLDDANAASHAIETIVGNAMSFRIICNSDERESFCGFEPVLPATLGSTLDAALANAEICSSTQVPKGTVAIMNDCDGVLIVRFAEPRIALIAAERLIAAAFHEYLGVC